MVPCEFRPNQLFDERKHVVDSVAKHYLERADDDVRHLVPAGVAADGNCLYNSMLLLMDNPSVTTDELRGTHLLFLIFRGSTFIAIFFSTHDR